MPGSSKTTMRRHKTADSSREVPPPRSSWTQEQRRLRREKVEAAEHPVGAASAPVGAASAPLGAPSAARGAATIRCQYVQTRSKRFPQVSRLAG